MEHQGIIIRELSEALKSMPQCIQGSAQMPYDATIHPGLLLKYGEAQGFQPPEYAEYFVGISADKTLCVFVPSVLIARYRTKVLARMAFDRCHSTFEAVSWLAEVAKNGKYSSHRDAYSYRQADHEARQVAVWIACYGPIPHEEKMDA